MIGLIKGTMRQAKEVSGLPLPIASYKANMKAPIRSLNVAITAQQSGSGDPSPDNIRPISGVSECNVVRCGTNVWDEEWEKVSSHIASKNYIPVLPETTYYWNSPAQPANGLMFYDVNKNLISTIAVVYNHLLTTPANCYYIKFKLSSTYGTTYNNDISINYPATDTSYHAYNGNTYTIQLGDTYYGGSLYVMDGVLTVTNAIVDLGSLNWVKENATPEIVLFRANKSDALFQGNCVCSIYTLYNGILTNFPNNSVSITNSQMYPILRIRDTRFDEYTEAQAKTALAGVKLVYPLATPITVQLTPTQVEQLLGANNVWADTGDVEELEYFDRQVYYGR